MQNKTSQLQQAAKEADEFWNSLPDRDKILLAQTILLAEDKEKTNGNRCKKNYKK